MLKFKIIIENHTLILELFYWLSMAWKKYVFDRSFD